MNSNSSLKSTFIAATFLFAGLAMLPSDSSNPTAPPPAFAGGVGTANDETETLFTSSADGKTIYMWQCFSSKPPKFLGKSEAVLQEK